MHKLLHIFLEGSGCVDLAPNFVYTASNFYLGARGRALNKLFCINLRITRTRKLLKT